MEPGRDKDAEVPVKQAEPRDHAGSRMWRAEVRLRSGWSHTFEVIRMKTIPEFIDQGCS